MAWVQNHVKDIRMFKTHEVFLTHQCLDRHEDGDSFSSKASLLGFAPGFWPKLFAIPMATSLIWELHHFTYDENDEMIFATYWPRSDEMGPTVIVYND